MLDGDGASFVWDVNFCIECFHLHQLVFAYNWLSVIDIELSVDAALETVRWRV